MRKTPSKPKKLHADVRKFDKGKVEHVKVGKGTMELMTLEPGWRWSTHVKDSAKLRLSETPQFQCQLSGRLHIVMEDGTEIDTKPGDVSLLPAGHDAWVVGTERVVLVDWAGARTIAKN